MSQGKISNSDFAFLYTLVECHKGRVNHKVNINKKIARWLGIKPPILRKLTPANNNPE